jgi:hypothetical protein
MKKILIALLISFVTVTSFAQIQRSAPLSGNNNNQSDSSAMNTPSLKQQMQALNLTKEQKIQIREIHQNAKTTRETIMANDSLSQDQKKLQLKQLHKQTVKNIDDILNDEQREKMKAIRENIKQNKNNQQNAAMEEEIMSLPAD